MIKNLKITVIVDDYAEPPFMAEHGLAFWIEADSTRILFDTGQGGALPKNAALLGLDLGVADIVVLSHGHYDHTGGLAHVIDREQPPHVYFHKNIMRPRYSMTTGTPRSIGIAKNDAKLIERLPNEKRHPITSATEFMPGVWLTGEVPRNTDFEDVGGAFFLDPLGRMPDLIEDDISMWFETPHGLVVCLGCCHSGVVNTLEHIAKAAGESRFVAVIGGMHLLHADQRRLDKTAKSLQKMHIESMRPCHCTGTESIKKLHRLIDAFPVAAITVGEFIAASFK
jgi:7,8-dihydropterin-6-yl-methyl-4-(beta-D-ribofuranosyl)aminobenzene 5'-phosphate synthase